MFKPTLVRSVQNLCSRLNSTSSGLSFEFSDDQKQLKDAADHFVKEEVIPVAGKYDKTLEFPWEVIKKAHANGFMNLDIPTEYGGLDMDLVSNSIVAESFGYGCTGIGTVLNANDLASTPLIVAANDDIKKRFLTRLVEEPLVAPGAGSDVAAAKTKAVKKVAITFEDVVVPQENVIGEVGKGFVVAMKTFDKTRPLVAAMAVGLASRALDEAAKYSLERKTFGVQIAAHQGVSFILADTAVNVELARLMTYRSAAYVDSGRPGSYFASIAKLFAADIANKAATDAVQIFGGNGFNTEYPVEKLMRDAKIFQIYEGTSQIQRVVISRQLLQRIKDTGTASANF